MERIIVYNYHNIFEVIRKTCIAIMCDRILYVSYICVKAFWLDVKGYRYPTR